MQMLVDERKQVRALLLDPVKRRGLARPFRSGRECRMFVEAALSEARLPLWEFCSWAILGLGAQNRRHVHLLGRGSWLKLSVEFFYAASLRGLLAAATVLMSPEDQGRQLKR
jgi:hypothetical protein